MGYSPLYIRQRVAFHLAELTGLFQLLNNIELRRFCVEIHRPDARQKRAPRVNSRRAHLR